MAVDPYKYFRIEARELVDVLAKALLDLDKNAPTPETVGQMLRAAHTLKGAARVVKQREIADHAHAIEEALGPHRNRADRIGPDASKAVLSLIGAIEQRLLALEAPVERDPRPGTAAPSAEQPFSALRANVSEIHELVELVSQAQVELAGLRAQLGRVGRVGELARSVADRIAGPRAKTSDLGSLASELEQIAVSVDRGLTRGIDGTERELRQVREAAERLRLAPVELSFTALERAARDVASAQGKRVSFEARGGDVRIEPASLRLVLEAMQQVVRNAVAHGIEQQGKIEIEVSRRGSRVLFRCRDDGRGIDLEAVRQVLRQRGMPAARAADLDRAELIERLLAGGLSTSPEVTELSGRGIGLELVRITAERLRGEVRIESEPGLGTEVELAVPISLAALEAIIVRSGPLVVALPIDCVVRTLPVQAEEIARSPKGDSLAFESSSLPFVELERLIGKSQQPSKRGAWPTLIVQSPGGRAALAVESLLGTEQIVCRPLPELAPCSALVAGAALDDEGNPRLVLDPDALVAHAAELRGAELVRARERLRILVVDDSLTTRMLEQSILESAGYAVELATSAEEGLLKAKSGGHALFLVDVEMPGMDGFSFIERTQADPELRRVPAILVTSRSSAEDRKRGEQVGARDYVVKGEFDQGKLLRRIRELTT